jgi:NTP pyrophosphatase (non-canonical NTP hydrolase)
MTYYLYHIPGKKIGVTCNLKHRVEKQQGYNEGEYDVILRTDDISLVSEAEISLQKAYGYRVDSQLYKDLYRNNFKQLNNMNINITEQTTTFPCPANKLKGQLMDNIGMNWETDHGDCKITNKSIGWIMKNVQTSKYNNERCYVYNKAFARYFDNNDAHSSNGTLADAHVRERYAEDQYDGKTLAGAMGERACKNLDKPQFSERDCDYKVFNIHFDLIREWADKRGLYENGDTKTQALKLVEEVGETCRAILKEDYEEITDGIGDCVVVLTNLAELHGVSIEDCIERAYHEIKNRKGKMINGTYKKD